MRKRAALMLAACLILLVCTGCGRNAPNTSENAAAGMTTELPQASSANPSDSPDSTKPSATLRIVTSFYPMYLFTANIATGIDGVSVHNMAAPQVGCLHDYQLLPGDLRALEDADLLVINGAGMEPFLDKVRAQQPNLPVIEASEGIAILADETQPASDEQPAEPNAHVWVDPRNAATEVRTIARHLAQLDPTHAAAYTANAEAYAARLEALYQRMRAGLADLQSRDLFTFHEAFAYFAAAFDLHVTGVIEREPGTEPGTRDLTEVVDLVRAQHIGALFVEPQYPSRVADVIATETGAKVFTLDPAASGPMVLTAYEDIMERNLRTLQEALR